MASQWYCQHDGKEQGPFTAAQLRKLVEFGTLVPTDLVWRGDSPKKVLASNVSGLFPAKPHPSARPCSPQPQVPPPLPTTQHAPPALQQTVLLPPAVPATASSVTGSSSHDVAFREPPAMPPPLPQPAPQGNRSWGTPQRLAIAGAVALILLGLCSITMITLSRGSKGFTQSILNLSAARQKEYGISVRKGTKALYAPGSVEDFVQSLTLFHRPGGGPDATTWDTKNPIWYDVKEINESNSVDHAYQLQLSRLFIKRKCWDAVYGPRAQVRAVNESTGADRRFGGGNTILMDHWMVPCATETVLVRGYSSRSPLAMNATRQGAFVVEWVHFDLHYDTLCPRKKGDDGCRRLLFDYKDKQRRPN